MLTEIYIEALLVDEQLADQVWEAWTVGEVNDQPTALALNPSMGGVEYELGVTFLLEGDYAAAASAFEREPIDVFGNLASRRSPTPGSG